MWTGLPGPLVEKVIRVLDEFVETEGSSIRQTCAELQILEKVFYTLYKRIYKWDPIDFN